MYKLLTLIVTLVVSSHAFGGVPTSFLGAGCCNTVSSPFAGIVGGCCNTVPDSPYSIIGGGAFNRFYGANDCFSVIVGGCSNVSESRYTGIAAGACNYINQGSHFSVISGGCCNTAYVGCALGISSGFFNKAGGCFSVISGGSCNNVQNNNSNIAGGFCNQVQQSYNNIAGGRENNIAAGSYSNIGGGMGNYISNGTGIQLGNTIAGGNSNRICLAAASFIGAGGVNCIGTNSAYGVIGGGGQNCIVSGTSSTHSGILGGYKNTVRGACSAILGGSGNVVPPTYDYVGIFGCNIIANHPCAFHANEFVSKNMCDMSFGGLLPPVGTLYYCTIGGSNHVFIV